MATFGESVIEEAALDWLRELRYTALSGAESPPGPASLRATYADVVLPDVLRGALKRLNPKLPGAALEDVYRKVTRPEAPQSTRETTRLIGCWLRASRSNTAGRTWQSPAPRRPSLISTSRRTTTGSR